MKTFGLYILLSLLTGNPILALLILLIIFLVAERRFVGILPDVFKPWRQSNRIRQIKKEVQINPANADAYLDLGEAYFRRGKYREAADFLENASDKMAGHPLFHFLLGASYYHLGKTDKGVEEIHKAVQENPRVSYGEPYVYLIRMNLEKTPQDDKLETVLEQLLLYGSPRTFYEAGRLFLNGGDKERARRLFQETIESYEVCRGALRRVNRKWAVLSKIALLSAK